MSFDSGRFDIAASQVLTTPSYTVADASLDQTSGTTSFYSFDYILLPPNELVGEVIPAISMRVQATPGAPGQSAYATQYFPDSDLTIREFGLPIGMVQTVNYYGTPVYPIIYGKVPKVRFQATTTNQDPSTVLMQQAKLFILWLKERN